MDATRNSSIEDLKRESESRLIVDSIPGLVAVFTPGGELEFVNRPILDYFGKTFEELKHWGTGGTTHPEDLPIVTGDRIQLQQVILNLLRNALEAMVEVHERPRLLQIKTAREDVNRVRLTVRDAGIGLPPQSVDSLFEAFYTTKSAGMGIGLFVSRSIVERHQGRLWAEPNDGPGATFSFSIPLQTT